MRRPIYGMLVRAKRRTSLHMPGCQGRAPFGGVNPYRLETTETPLTDNLYQPTGAIAEAQQLAAIGAGAQATLLLHDGSTAGIQTMLLYACRRGDAIVLPRNAHVSCLNTCAVAGITPVFAEPSYTRSGRVYTTADAYARALDAHPEAKAALALRVDYYGLLSDVAGIARETHARGKLLLCDEAHGAYFNWRADVPTALACGADLSAQSAHKTLPSLTASAWLHAGANVDVERLRGILRMTQTSSPSYMLMLSLDDARAWMDAHGASACERLRRAMEGFRASVGRLGFEDGQDDAPDGLAYDRLRLVLRWRGGGRQLESELARRGLDVEMSDDCCVVCILSLMDGERRLRKLERALRSIAKQPFDDAATETLPTFDAWPPRLMPLDVAAFAESETLEPTSAIGRVSAAAVGPYPPGTAWLTPGDEITGAVVERLAPLAADHCFGMTNDHRLRCVKAARTEQKE